MKRLAMGVAAMALAACATMGGRPPESMADGQFRSIYEAEWAWRLSLDPEEDDDTIDEDKAPKTWGRVDPATQAERLAHWKGVIEELNALDQKALSPKAQINLAIYREQIEVRMSLLDQRRKLRAEGFPFGRTGPRLHRPPQRHAALFP